MKAVEDRIKRSLRKELLGKRRSLTPEQIAGKSAIITSRVLQSWEYQQARTVLLYADFDCEVATGDMIASALRDGKRVLLPRVRPGVPWLDLYFVEDVAKQVAPGSWNIPEPRPEACEPGSLADIECVIAPGIGFDIHGGRLGYGGGYYDRLLNSLTPAQARVAVGLGFELQLVHEVPRGFFDASVSIICTEMNLIDNR